MPTEILSYRGITCNDISGPRLFYPRSPSAALPPLCPQAPLKIEASKAGPLLPPNTRDHLAPSPHHQTRDLPSAFHQGTRRKWSAQTRAFEGCLLRRRVPSFLPLFSFALLPSLSSAANHHNRRAVGTRSRTRPAITPSLRLRLRRRRHGCYPQENGRPGRRGRRQIRLRRVQCRHHINSAYAGQISTLCEMPT